MTGELLTYWTIRIAAICFALVAVSALTDRLREPVAAPALMKSRLTVRSVWTLGAGLALAHVLLAMHFFHGWNHSSAVNSIAAETEQLLGVRVGWGIWFNWLFVACWVTDAAWSWIAPVRYANRSATVKLLCYGYLAFIMFNGVVVFASGQVRWIGIAVTVLLLTLTAALTIRNRTASRVHRQASNQEN